MEVSGVICLVLLRLHVFVLASPLSRPPSSSSPCVSLRCFCCCWWWWWWWCCCWSRHAMEFLSLPFSSWVGGWTLHGIPDQPTLLSPGLFIHAWRSCPCSLPCAPDQRRRARLLPLLSHASSRSRRMARSGSSQSVTTHSQSVSVSTGQRLTCSLCHLQHGLPSVPASSSLCMSQGSSSRSRDITRQLPGTYPPSATGPWHCARAQLGVREAAQT